jgi:DNA polymerase-3 subunit beta
VRFSAPKTGLGSAVAKVQGAVTPGSGVKVTVADGTVRLVAFNGELAISTRFDASQTADGTVVVPGRLLHDMVHACGDGTVTVNAAGDDVTVAADGVTYRVPTIAGEYPKLTRPGGDDVTVDAVDLIAAFRQTAFAVARDNTHQGLSGVLFHSSDTGLRLAATDSFRLAVRRLGDVAGLPAGKAIVPVSTLTAAVKVLARADKVTVRVDDRHLSMSDGDTTVMTSLIAAHYPDVDRIIPVGDLAHTLRVDRAGLLQAVNQVRVVARAGSNVGRFTMSSDAVTLAAVDAGAGQATVNVAGDFTGEPLEIGLALDFLADAVNACTGDTVELATVGPLTPVRITGADPDYVHVCMVTRLHRQVA